MEEKIIEAQFTKNKLSRILLAISLGLISLGVIIAWSIYSTGTEFSIISFYGTYYSVEIPYKESFNSYFDFLVGFMLTPFNYSDWWFLIIIDLGIVLLLAFVFFAWQMSKCALTVTNRRVTGKASFGKSVDLPLKQISAVSLGGCKSISVATSSGKLHFWFIKNREEVHTALNDIIGKVQVETAYTPYNTPSAGSADELKKYKDLLDAGVISQEEFDAKKKQLLGL